MKNYQDRLHRAIPGGAHTYSRGSDQFPTNAPNILARGFGAYVWDGEGSKYLDYGMALRAVTLGYADERVNAAAYRQIELGNNLTRASFIELEAAELLIDLIPSVDMVKFTKNGSNATTAAVKIARAYTERSYIAIPRQHPFFSFDDWFIGTTALQRGIPHNSNQYTLIFDYNNIESLRKLFEQYPGKIAAVMMEPATTLIPCNPNAADLSASPPCVNCSCELKGHNFLKQVQQICHREGSLFILDEMITGFRWHLKGAQTYFDVSPDLCTFGKGMANGFSVAAVGGRREIMEVGSINTIGSERTFLLSTTHGGEMCGLGAFVEVVHIYQKESICEKLWAYGKELRSIFNSAISDYGLQNFLALDGPDISLNYLTYDQNSELSLKFRTLFSQEMIRHGVLMPWIAVSASHGQKELEITSHAIRNALKVYKEALELGVEHYLEGTEIKPVFRRFN
ncbi:glutamate-1-semialdehyde 2,1-aminomutase [Polynucleobacter paneuropaeus]|nr:glutamate-1-semialdehyde 2,1-aminomutase [Polynucleobacter paneuropaeus]